MFISNRNSVDSCGNELLEVSSDSSAGSEIWQRNKWWFKFALFRLNRIPKRSSRLFSLILIDIKILPQRIASINEKFYIKHLFNTIYFEHYEQFLNRTGITSYEQGGRCSVNCVDGHKSPLTPSEPSNCSWSGRRNPFALDERQLRYEIKRLSLR